MKVSGRYGSFTPKPHQAGYYAKRAKRQQQQRHERAASLRAWLDQHKSCVNGCGQPVAFYDTINYALQYSGCCSREWESALQVRVTEKAFAAKQNNLHPQAAVSGLLHREAMIEEKKPKRGKDSTSTKRAGAHLTKLAESGGAPVRVDTHGDDLKLLDGLVADGYAPSRAEAYRKAMREAHARVQKKIQKNAK